jgi:hypothetical protein
LRAATRIVRRKYIDSSQAEIVATATARASTPPSCFA